MYGEPDWKWLPLPESEKTESWSMLNVISVSERAWEERLPTCEYIHATADTALLMLMVSAPIEVVWVALLAACSVVPRKRANGGRIVISANASPPTLPVKELKLLAELISE